MIKDYEFYVSSDGVNWGIVVFIGVFVNNINLKEVSFVNKIGCYIKLCVLSEVNNNLWISVVEINVFGVV